MTNFDWMDELNALELIEIAEHATHLLTERDRQSAKAYIEVMRDYCLAIDNLHTDIPITLPYAKWCDLACDFDRLLTRYFS